MDEKKQIKEMANDIYENRPHKDIWLEDAEDIAKVLYEKGYRRQSDNATDTNDGRKSEWISVDERLPTEQKEFLAYYGFDNGDGDLGMMFTGVLTYFACDKRPHFQHEDLRLRVTHWMPLPEAPKMKGGAE
jgi:hypothetical protein